MKTFNDLNYFLLKLNYKVGTLIAKFLTESVGNGTQIHRTVIYNKPSKISIGCKCEIRQGTILDARSNCNISIKIGDGTRIKDYVALMTYGGKIEIGKNVLIGRLSTLFGHGNISIGENSMLSPHTMVVSSEHLAYLSEVPFQHQGFTREPVFIGNNVWIGANTTILSGTTIHNDVVIGAGSIVSGDLESGWLYTGVPAKAKKQLCNFKHREVKVYTRDWDLLK